MLTKRELREFHRRFEYLDRTVLLKHRTEPARYGSDEVRVLFKDKRNDEEMGRNQEDFSFDTTVFKRTIVRLGLTGQGNYHVKLLKEENQETEGAGQGPGTVARRER